MKKMRLHAIYIILVSLIFIGFGCKTKKATKDLEKREVEEKVENIQEGHEFSKPVVYVYHKFGFMGGGSKNLYISKLNQIDSSKIHKPCLSIDSFIQKVVLDFYFNECDGDSLETSFKVKDVYINTIYYWNRLKSIYVVLLKRIPSNKVTSKIIFCEGGGPIKEFHQSQIGEFNLHALYNFENGELVPSKLKEELNFNYPEIRFIPRSKNGSATAFKFIRLYHNGTSNAIETSIIELKNQKLDTLYFNREWIE